MFICMFVCVLYSVYIYIMFSPVGDLLLFDCSMCEVLEASHICVFGFLGIIHGVR